MIFKKLKLILFILAINKEYFNKVSLNQRIKGIKKYGKPIENCKIKDYNWKKMATEEIVDCWEYIKMIKKSKIK